MERAELRSRFLLAAAALAFAAACGNGAVDRRTRVEPSPSGSASTAAVSASSGRVLLSFLRALPVCDVSHRGLLLDAGTEALAGRYGWTAAVPAGITSVEHDGSTWSRITDRRVNLTFTQFERTPIFVSTRAVGYSSRSAQVYLDDQSFGSLTFAHEQIKITTTATTALPVDPGLHTLSIRFVGRAKDGDAFADLDWIRVGVPDELTETYGAPTLRDLVASNAALGGVPHKAIALRAPGSVRCSTRLSKRTRFRVSVGMQGEGTADTEIRILRDGQKTQVVDTVQVEGGPGARWIDVDRPLDDYGSSVAAVELIVTSATKGARVLFGDPEVVVDGAAPTPAPAARAAVFVVLDGVERSELPPWSTGSTSHLPVLTELATSATTFDHHRAPTTVVAASVASLLTGLPPGAHALADAGSRLPAAQTTLASVAREASIRSAMFTGVPQTFRAFGFATPWERFVEHAPNSGDPSSAPLDSATAWVGELGKGPDGARFFAVVHARGGHPPWDVTAKELTTVPPKDYTGLIEPRRAAQTLARLRHRRAREVINDADRQRMHALEAIALGREDHALGNLIAALKSANLWESTLFVVTGDVGSGIDESSLYADGLDLKETHLALPLYVHFPNSAFSGRRVVEPTEMYDVTKTALHAFGLTFAKPGLGRDLAEVASGFEDGMGAPQIATLGSRYSARWGDLVLTGKLPQAPELCDLSLDVACAFNRRETMPIAVAAIFQRIAATPGAVHIALDKREPATLDADTLASLSVWGASD